MGFRWKKINMDPLTEDGAFNLGLSGRQYPLGTDGVCYGRWLEGAHAHDERARRDAAASGGRANLIAPAPPPPPEPVARPRYY